MFIQLHVICIFMLFMKHQDVHNDWFMWTKARNVMRTCKYCENICLRISRAVAVTKLSTKLWNARILTELQPVQNLRIFFNNLIMFKIDLRKLWSQRPVWCSKPAQPRAEFMTMDLQIHDKRSKFLNFFAHSATALFRRDSHWIWYNSCVWRRCWTWFRRWSFGPTKAFMLDHWLDDSVQPKEFRIVLAEFVWN